MAQQFERLKTALADRYAVQEEIGAGGMATVYLAEDLKLHRKVAVKVLRPELAAALGPERFLREIEIAANLHHPHILALHDSGEADGFLYYVMPYVEGESLRDRLNREKQLPLDDALQFAREVADALSYAHSHDVVHRDIKPENILLEAGHAVIADFGIARAVTAAGGDHLTETGVSIGTPHYMSPEQCEGASDIDGRTDIYALGSVLYELLAGEPPYTGPTAQAIIAKRLSEPVPHVSTLRETVPPTVEAAITKALAKAPADRYATAGQLAEALDRRVVASSATATVTGATARNRWYAIGAAAMVAVLGVWLGIRTLGSGAGDASSELPRIVVLPLENLSSSEEDFFADGMTEEITSRLAGISGLLVISRQTAVQYKGSTKTAQEIAEELDVAYVLEGTVRTDRSLDGGGQVRITPQLIRASDDTHLWSEIYTADLVPGEIFSIQTQIAERITESMDIVLLEPERRRLAARPTDNQEAYDYFLRGNDYRRRSGEEQNTQIAIQMYQKAVELDPDFALGYARLSIVHSRMWWFFYDRTQERLAMAKEAVDKALRLDPDLPEAHVALGRYHYWGHLEYDRALAEFAIAQKSQPNNGGLFYGIGSVQRRQGKMREALPNFIKLAELNPRSGVAAYEVAGTYFLLNKPVEAARHFDRAIFLSPDQPNFYADKARWVHLRLEGSTERARAVLEAAQGVAEGANITFAWVLIEMLDGNYQEALDRLALVSSEVLSEGQFLYVPKAQLYAQIHGLMGNRQRERAYYDSARSMLETKIEERPDDTRYRSALGIAYAGLGSKEDAIREGELAVELLPMSKEAWRGAYRAEDLARIYTMVGEYDAAIDRLENLLTVPSITAVPMLRINPVWDPLRDNPRFQALLAKYGN